MERKKLVVTGGGTGGHLFPAIAAAQEFCKQYPGAEVLFVGTRRRMDGDTLQRYGLAGKSIRCYGLKGKSVKELIKAVAVLPISCLQALWILLSFRPHLVLGVGGYVTGPVVAMAKMCRIPTLIHEQNSVPGLANRKLGAFVDRICLSLPASARFFDSNKTVLTGNPVRQNLLFQRSAFLRGDVARPTVVVLGGSQGAIGLNRLVVDAFTIDAAELDGVDLIHQTGSRDLEWVKSAYDKAGRKVEVSAFFSDMETLYQRADILISRAGATTLAELAVLGKPALLVPYPHAADDHQQKNAEYYVAGGGALLFPEKSSSGFQIRCQLLRLLTDKETLEQMSQSQKKLAITDAAERIVAECRAMMK